MLLKNLIFFLFFSKKKYSHKNEKIMPNEVLISWFETMVLEIHEEFNKAFEVSKKLKEFSPILFKQMSLLLEHCLHLHLDFHCLAKNRHEHFIEKMQPTKQLTLHQIEAFIGDHLLDIMIILQQTLDETKTYATQLSSYVENKI